MVEVAPLLVWARAYRTTHQLSVRHFVRLLGLEPSPTYARYLSLRGEVTPGAYGEKLLEALARFNEMAITTSYAPPPCRRFRSVGNIWDEREADEHRCVDISIQGHVVTVIVARHNKLTEEELRAWFESKNCESLQDVVFEFRSSIPLATTTTTTQASTSYNTRGLAYTVEPDEDGYIGMTPLYYKWRRHGYRGQTEHGPRHTEETDPWFHQPTDLL